MRADRRVELVEHVGQRQHDDRGVGQDDSHGNRQHRHREARIGGPAAAFSHV